MPSRHRRYRSQKGVSELSQLPLVLYVLFIIVLLPVLNLVTLLVAGTTQYLATNDIAAKAATQPDYTSALNSMMNEAFQFQSSGLAKFVNMDPEGGYGGCGGDLYLLATNIGSGAVTSSPADQPLTQAINTQASMYELQVRSVYSVSPLVSLEAVPVLGNVPGLGKPVTLTFTANRPVEHPSGLQPASSGGLVTGGGTVAPFTRVASNPATPAPPGPGTWRDPGIFQAIRNAGHTVLSVNVVNVPACPTDPTNNGSSGFVSQWISSGVTVQTGQQVWIDTNATGTWEFSGFTPLDANGDPSGQMNGGSGNVWMGAASFALVGYVGNPPPNMPMDHQYMALPANAPGFLLAGDTMLNCPITRPGTVWLTCNDNQAGDMGNQFVRIIVTQ